MLQEVETKANIAKHADATTVDITVASVDDDVELRVSDNGRGFDASAKGSFVADGHFGLAGMGERVAMLDGSMKLDTAIDAGTTLIFRIPALRQPVLTATGAN